MITHELVDPALDKHSGKVCYLLTRAVSSLPCSTYMLIPGRYKERKVETLVFQMALAPGRDAQDVVRK